MPRQRRLVVPPAPLRALRSHRLLRLVAEPARNGTCQSDGPHSHKKLRAWRRLVLRLQNRRSAGRSSVSAARAPSAQSTDARSCRQGAARLATPPPLSGMVTPERGATPPNRHGPIGRISPEHDPAGGTGLPRNRPRPRRKTLLQLGNYPQVPVRALRSGYRNRSSAVTRSRTRSASGTYPPLCRVAQVLPFAEGGVDPPDGLIRRSPTLRHVLDDLRAGAVKNDDRPPCRTRVHQASPLPSHSTSGPGGGRLVSRVVPSGSIVVCVGSWLGETNRNIFNGRSPTALSLCGEFGPAYTAWPAPTT